MIKNLKLPKGRVSKVFKGRPDALKRMMPILRKKGFTGYLKVVRADRPGEGYLIMKDGQDVVTLFNDPDGLFRGKGALPRIRDVAKDPGSLIEVHADMDMDDLLDSFRTKSGRISRGFGVLRKKLEELRTQQEEPGAKEAAPARETIRDLADYLGGEEEKPRRGGKAKKAKTAKRTPKGKKRKKARKAPPRPREDEAPAPTGGEAEPEPDASVEGEERPLPAAPEDLEPAPPEVEPEAEILQEPTEEVAPEPAGKAEAEEEPKPPKAKARKKGRPKRQEEKEDVVATAGILSRFTFDNFIVGESNRFAHAACKAISEGAVDPYNPLLLVGTPGLGKTHLLHAVGNRFLERGPTANVLYMTATRFWSEIQAADRDATISEFREAFRSLDLLLLDDVQDIEDRKRVQEELFEIFEAFRGQGKPLVMVADRYPSGMQGVDARLRSRFESGLVVDLRSPDLEIRRAFVVFQLARKEVGFSADIPDFLAERFAVGMRELEGGVNRVLAYAEAMGKPLEVAVAREALGDQSQADDESRGPARLPDLLPGHSYLFEESRGETAYRAFAQKVTRIRGLLISRTNPARVQEIHGIEGADIYWLTDKQDSSERTVEPVLERILHRMESFMVAGGQGVLMLDGLEFLKSSNSFEAVLKFVRRLVDEIAESEFIFMLTLNPATWEERDLRTLEGEAEVVNPA